MRTKLILLTKKATYHIWEATELMSEYAYKLYTKVNSWK